MFREICEVRELTEEEKKEAEEKEANAIALRMSKVSTKEIVEFLGLDLDVGKRMLERAEESGAALQAALRGHK